MAQRFAADASTRLLRRAEPAASRVLPDGSISKTSSERRPLRTTTDVTSASHSCIQASAQNFFLKHLRCCAQNFFAGNLLITFLPTQPVAGTSKHTRHERTPK